MTINIQPISNVLGILLLLFGGLMLLCVPVDEYYGESLHAMAYSGLITVITGFALKWYTFSTNPTVGKREGYLIVALGWLTMGIFGAIPYILTDVNINFTDAIFESISGLTTTGASIMNDIESMPKGLLLWRSLTQWVGGMGIIVLTIALFPMLGIGGVELFVAESPGPTTDKIKPRIKETAKRLWFIYVSLTVILAVLLFVEGMTGYDAVNHSLTTMATGGFSTKNASIAFYSNPAIHYTIILFMIFAGTNFSVLYFLFKGRFDKVLKNEEFKYYILTLIFLGIVITSGIYYYSGNTFEKSFRDGIFQLVSIITTTGFVSADYTSWSLWLTVLFFFLLFIGASAGSTAGGIKMIRHIVFIKNTYLEFKRILHPRGLIRMRLNGELVPPRILTHILVFLLVYLILFSMGTFLLSIDGLDIQTAMGASATCLGNVGPGIGNVGPLDNFANIPVFSKYVLSFLMLCGRLELFTILILFTPFFWRAN